MDKVFIENLDVQTVIGVHAWERQMLQHVRLDLEMAFDCRAAGASDVLADALDYDRVAAAVTSLVEASRHELLEALAESVAAMVLRDFAVAQLRLQVRKPGAVGNAEAVGVVIERAVDAR